MMDPLLSETCWSTFRCFTILIISTNYIFVHLLDNEVFVIDARCKHEVYKQDILAKC